MNHILNCLSQIGISMFYNFTFSIWSHGPYSPPPNVIMSVSSDEEGNKLYLSK